MIIFRRARPGALSHKPTLPFRSRCLSTQPLDKLLSKPVQSYISSSRDPYLNLSIEHHFLQKSDPESTILFIYVNQPSIILGRNQNPWLEVNLRCLSPSKNAPDRPHVKLVRRRSGGGTVFHDEGNVNWSVICPSNAFTRDRHAEMVVRALRSCGIDRARVNTRHDIVLDQGDIKSDPVDPKDTHATIYQVPETDESRRPLKVSGSAYKLTRGRALHHGTCLLSSPNLAIIPDYLHSPAKGMIEARGVESVNSPVTNIGLANETFIEAVQKAFAEMYHANDVELAVEVGPETLEHEDIKKGYNELLSPEWKFLQTPQFTLMSQKRLRFSKIQTHRDLSQSRTIEKLSKSVTTLTRTGLELVDPQITARNGEITEVSTASGFGSAHDVKSALVGRKIHEIWDWQDVLRDARSTASSAVEGRAIKRTAYWLNRMFPRVQ